MRKFNIVAVTVSLLIIIGAAIFNYYERLQNEELTKIATEKSEYVNLSNPYYLNKEILNGNDANNTLIVFMANKSNYYAAQRELDNRNYDKSIEYAEKINLESFNVLKNDIKGDVYFYKGEIELAKEHYDIAIRNISPENTYLKEAIFLKYQRVQQ